VAYTLNTSQLLQYFTQQYSFQPNEQVQQADHSLQDTFDGNVAIYNVYNGRRSDAISVYSCIRIYANRISHIQASVEASSTWWARR